MNREVKELLKLFEGEMVYPDPMKDLFLTADFAAADGFDNNNISAAVNTTLAFINFNEGSVN